MSLLKSKVESIDLMLAFIALAPSKLHVNYFASSTETIAMKHSVRSEAVKKDCKSNNESDTSHLPLFF